MEKIIKIAELLKGCPKGMELDCALYEDVYFDYVDEFNIIHCYIQHETHKTSIQFNPYGTVDSEVKSKCVIFPKGKTTWEGFVPPCKLKNGDVVVVGDDKALQMFIVEEQISAHLAKCYIGYDFDDNIIFDKGNWAFDRFATEEEKQKLFDALKDKGYKWNAEAKTLEKLTKPKFKVGDKIQDKSGFKAKIIEVREDKEYYIYETLITRDIGKFSFSDQNDYELVPNKFDISTLKPFESKVLVRGGEDCFWKPAIFGFCIKINFYVLGGNVWEQCIPYKDNEHLLGTTDDCDEFYKNWE